MNTQKRGKSSRTVAAGPVRLTIARSTCSAMVGVRTSPTTETRKRPIMIPILLSIRFHAIKWGWVASYKTIANKRDNRTHLEFRDSINRRDNLGEDHQYPEPRTRDSDKIPRNRLG